MKHFLVFIFALFAVPLLGAEAAPQNLDWIDKIVGWLPDSLPVWAGALVAFIFELLLRIWPTAKPKSLLLVVIVVLRGLEKIFEKLAALLDDIVQNIKDK